MVKSLPANRTDERGVGSIPGLVRSVRVRNGTDSSILAWKIPWKEGLDGLQSVGS